MRSLLRFGTFALLGLAAISAAQAQVRVDLSLPRSLFIRYEPLLAVVTITNQSGRELELADEGNYKWFSFKVQSTDGRLVPPYDPDYQLSPIQLGPGQKAKRLVNLTPLYPLTEFGVYRITASIYSREMNQYFSSHPPLNVEITEGRELWQETVGVPDGSAARTVTLLAHRLPNNTQLYLRIVDAEGRVFCTHQLGRYVSFGVPAIKLDAGNNIHIFQNVAPKQFLYSLISLSGEVLERKTYQAVTDKPRLARDTAGGVRVVGGVFVDPDAVPAEDAAAKPPGVGDRPVPVPESAE
jgi:hypothetical protein